MKLGARRVGRSTHCCTSAVAGGGETKGRHRKSGKARAPREISR